MGVEVTPVLSPVTEGQRNSLVLVSKADAHTTEHPENGSSFLLNPCENVAFRAVNQIFQSGGSVSFAPGKTKACGASSSHFVVAGLDRSRLLQITNTLHASVVSASRAPDSTPMRKARVGLYRPWMANIDEGWTRWILNNYDFSPLSLYNADLQAGHLRDRIDMLVVPDMSRKALMEGYEPGTLPGQYAGGIGEDGLSAIREFVDAGGTLVALNQASAAVIDLLHLPVKNTLAGLSADAFNCPGAILKVATGDPLRPVLAGSPAETYVMFERGPAFEPQPGFRGSILASYAKDASPLASGYVLHPELISG